MTYKEAWIRKILNLVWRLPIETICSECLGKKLIGERCNCHIYATNKNRRVPSGEVPIVTWKASDNGMHFR